MSETRNHTEVTLDRLGPLHYEATNSRGGTLPIGTGQSDEFTPVELMMAAIAGCSAIDVDMLTHRRAEPDVFTTTITADRVKDESGNRLDAIDVTFTIRFPEGEDGDRARRILERSVQDSHDRLCTVSRTVEAGTPVTMGLSED